MEHVIEQVNNLSFGTERTEGGMLLAVADKGRDSRSSKRPKQKDTSHTLQSRASNAGGSSHNVNSKESFTSRSIDKSSVEKTSHPHNSGDLSHEGEHHFNCGHHRPDDASMKFLLPKLGTNISKANKKLTYGYLK